MTHDDGTPIAIILVLWLLVFVAGSQALVIAPILPRIAEQLAVPEGVLGTLITAYAVTVGVFALITGPISDRVGRRAILLAGAAVMTVALALHWATWDFGSLLAVRAFAGVAGGILNGAAVAYVGDYFPRDRRGWANGWVFSGMAAGQIAGIPLGAVMADQLGYRWPFVAFAALMAVTVVLVWLLVPQPDVDLADRLTLRTAVASYATLLARRDVQAAVVIFLVMFGGNALYTTYLPTWLETTLGVGGAAIGGMFLLGGVANVIAGPRAGTLSDTVGRKRIIVGASVGLAALIVATPLLALNIWVVYAVFFGVMGLFAARATPFQTLMTEMVAGRQRGAFLNLTVGIGQFGSGIGGALAGAAFTSVGYGGTTLVAAVAMLAIGGLVWRFLPETAVGVATSAAAERPSAGEVAPSSAERATPPQRAEPAAATPAAEGAPGPGSPAGPSAPSTAEAPTTRFARRQACDALYGPAREAGYCGSKAATDEGATADDD